MFTHLSLYGTAVGILLLAKLLLSLPLRRRPVTPAFRDGPPLTVHAVITVYNETPGMLRRCLASLAAQTRPPQSVTVVDDCSHSRDAEHVVGQLRDRFRAAGIDLELIRFPENRGKRHGLAAGFTARPDADVYLCVDSDTVLDERALAELANPGAPDDTETTVELPVAKLLDPETETTLILPIPRPRNGAPLPEGTIR